MPGACGHCGAAMGGPGMGGRGGAPMACGSCGFSTCGGCGAGIGPGLFTCGSCGWGWGRPRESVTDEVGTYVASKAALQSLEDSGQGDSAAADVARAGMRSSQIQLIIGGVFLVIMIIVIISVLSHHNTSPNAPLALVALAVHHVSTATRALGPMVARRWW